MKEQLMATMKQKFQENISAMQEKQDKMTEEFKRNETVMLEKQDKMSQEFREQKDQMSQEFKEQKDSMTQEMTQLKAMIQQLLVKNSNEDNLFAQSSKQKPAAGNNSEGKF